jgi:hypothetical protein
MSLPGNTVGVYKKRRSPFAGGYIVFRAVEAGSAVFEVPDDDGVILAPRSGGHAVGGRQRTASV